MFVHHVGVSVCICECMNLFACGYVCMCNLSKCYVEPSFSGMGVFSSIGRQKDFCFNGHFSIFDCFCDMLASMSFVDFV